MEAWKTASTVPTTFDGSPPELLDSPPQSLHSRLALGRRTRLLARSGKACTRDLELSHQGKPRSRARIAEREVAEAKCFVIITCGIACWTIAAFIAFSALCPRLIAARINAKNIFASAECGSIMQARQASATAVLSSATAARACVSALSMDGCYSPKLITCTLRFLAALGSFGILRCSSP